MQLFKEKKWDEKWVILTNLVEAGNTTAFISLSDSASITLEAEGGVRRIDLADASLKLNIKSYSDVGLRVATDGNLRPLIGISGISTHLVGDDEFGSAHFNLALAREHVEKKKLKFEESFYFGRLR